MKFIEPDFARAAYLYIYFHENNDIECLTTEEMDRFNFLLKHFLCCIAFKTGTIKLNNTTKIIKIILKGYKKDEKYFITFNPTLNYNSALSPLVLTYDEDKKDQENKDFLNIKKFLSKISFDVITDIDGSIKFKLNYKK